MQAGCLAHIYWKQLNPELLLQFTQLFPSSINRQLLVVLLSAKEYVYIYINFIKRNGQRDKCDCKGDKLNTSDSYPSDFFKSANYFFLFSFLCKCILEDIEIIHVLSCFCKQSELVQLIYLNTLIIFIINLLNSANYHTGGKKSVIQELPCL